MVSTRKSVLSCSSLLLLIGIFFLTFLSLSSSSALRGRCSLFNRHQRFGIFVVSVLFKLCFSGVLRLLSYSRGVVVCSSHTIANRQFSSTLKRLYSIVSVPNRLLAYLVTHDTWVLTTQLTREGTQDKHFVSV